MNEDQFSIVVVCTGNICRSPVGEAILRHRLLSAARPALVSVTSAGTRCQPGTEIDARAAETLARLGIPVGPTAAQELTASLVRSADLILGATREHRAAAVRLLPAASARTFTVREFDRLLADLSPVSAPGQPAASPAEAGRALVRSAAQHRGRAVPGAPEDDDVPDPYRRSTAVYEACMEVLVQALERPAARLAAALGSPRP